MDIPDSQRMGNTTFFITLEDVHRNSLATRIYPSLEAIYVHFVLTIKSCHSVGVQISIVPFSLRDFPGQVFYSATGAYARCCDEIQQDDILSPTTDAAETIYKASVSWHNWNLRAPGFWSELEHTAQAHVRLDTCMDNVSNRLKQIMMETHALEPNLLLIDEGDMQASLRSSRSQKTTAPSSVSTESTTELDLPLKRKRKDRPSTPAEPVMGTADIFLERLGSASISDAEVSSYIALTNIESPPTSPSGENVSRAWEMCISFARRSNEKLKYGRFLRFLSLCFFLIWEKYSEKQGKSAARLVNAKMREAGFSGHSRGLKTMRDETTLINRIIASIQESCGFEQAGILYHVVFEASNYQLIRTINRLGNEKKSSILEYICDNVQLDSLSSSPTTAISVQRIIQQYLPNLSADAISAAIGYQAIERNRVVSIESLAGNRGSVSSEHRIIPCVAQYSFPVSMCMDLANFGAFLAGDQTTYHQPYAFTNGPIAGSNTPYDGFDSHMFTENDSGGVSGALDMLQRVDGSFLQFPVDMDSLNFDFSFDDVDM